MKQKEIVLIDSSFLISLAKIGGLSLLETFKKRTGVTLLVPYPVYQECVEDGIRSGYLDALFIKKEFDRGVVTVKDVEFSPQLPVDEILIRSAGLWSAKEVFVDDELLLKRVGKKGFLSRRSVEFLLDLVKKGDVSRSDYIEFLDRLVKRKRLSKEKRSFFEEV